MSKFLLKILFILSLLQDRTAWLCYNPACLKRKVWLIWQQCEVLCLGWFCSQTWWFVTLNWPPKRLQWKQKKSNNNQRECWNEEKPRIQQEKQVFPKACWFWQDSPAQSLFLHIVFPPPPSLSLPRLGQRKCFLKFIRGNRSVRENKDCKQAGGGNKREPSVSPLFYIFVDSQQLWRNSWVKTEKMNFVSCVFAQLWHVNTHTNTRYVFFSD